MNTRMRPQQVVRLRKDLKRQIKRADTLAARLMSQLCDGDLPSVDRETAEKRAVLLARTCMDLEQGLQQVDDAMSLP
jgi:hypothetical protein